MASFKLQTNIPIVGKLKYCDYSYSDKAKEEGWDPTLSVKGTWDGEGEQRLFLPMPCLDQLVALGIVAGGEPNGKGSYRALSPGGGGYGDPKTRDPERVLRDVRDGIVSATSAEKDYAVAIAADGKSIDKKRTNQLREEAPWSTVAPSSWAP